MRIRPAQLTDILKRVLRVSRVEIPSVGGSRFWVDPVSVFGLHLLERGAHEPGLARLLQSVIRPGDVFVDVGANEGYFSVLAARRGATVYAVEPLRSMAAVIRRNAEINGVASIRVEGLALGDRSATVDLYVRPSTNRGASSLFHHWRFGRVVERVPMVSFDQFVSDRMLSRIRLVKIDCEGSEKFIIPGMRRALERHTIDVLVVDYHEHIIGAATCSTLSDLIVRFGYQTICTNEFFLYALPNALEEAALGSAAALLVSEKGAA